MDAEQQARAIGDGAACSCGCADCGRDIYTLYRIALDQAAWIRELERRLADTQRSSKAGTK
jgi:hypothetical protein